MDLAVGFVVGVTDSCLCGFSLAFVLALLCGGALLCVVCTVLIVLA